MALAYDEEVRAHFSDGSLWVTLGQEPDLLPLLGQWIQALGDYDFKPSSEHASTNHLRILLQEKRMLLVIDDVWNGADAEKFRVGGSSCCVLITTREAVIAGAERYELDVLSENQAIELLKQAMKRELTTPESEQALALAKAVGYLSSRAQLTTMRESV